jgi:hypothetical protein
MMIPTWNWAISGPTKTPFGMWLLNTTLLTLLENMVLIHYALPPNLSQVERSSSKPLTRGCLVNHFHLNVCILDYC